MMVEFIKELEQVIDIIQVNIVRLIMLAVMLALLGTVLLADQTYELFAWVAGGCVAVVVITALCVGTSDLSLLRERLTGMGAAFKLFGGEYTDEMFSPAARRVVDIMLPGAKRGEAARSCLLLALELHRYTRLPLRHNFTWPIVVLAAAEAAATARCLVIYGCGDLPCILYFTPVVVFGLLGLWLLELVHFGRRFLHVLSYLRDEAERCLE